MNETLTLILAELREVRDGVREARDAALGAEEKVRALETNVGQLLGDIGSARKCANEALTRVQAVEVRLDERRVERAAKWAFAGSAIIAICSLGAVIWQTTRAQPAQPVPAYPLAYGHPLPRPGPSAKPARSSDVP